MKTRKIVLVGATAPGLYDIRPSPYRSTGREFLGVETNANIADTLLRTGARTYAGSSGLWAVFALVLGLAIGWVAWSRGEVTGPAIAALIFVLIAGPSYFFAFSYLYTVTPYGSVLLAGLLTGGTAFAAEPLRMSRPALVGNGIPGSLATATRAVEAAG